MNPSLLSRPLLIFVLFLPFSIHVSLGQEKATDGTTPKLEETIFPSIDLAGPGWRSLGEPDFKNVNCKPDTWSWNQGVLSCNGNCVGVLSSKLAFTNFEFVLEWKHLQNAGNSGVFVWAPQSVLDKLRPDSLPEGIECQVLDHGYTAEYEKSSGEKADWFTTNGDVFPVGQSKMKPFPPLSPNGQRSFPTSNHSLGFGQWNQYYIRAIDGEVRLWVNGHEVSGGQSCEPATGFLALEAEGAPIEFRNLRIRVLPECSAAVK